MISKFAVKIVLTLLFLLCLFRMPYGYYQLVHYVGMAGFIILVYLDFKKKDKTMVFIWFFSALLINPFYKAVLGRLIWNVVDILWSLALLISLFFDFLSYKRDTSFN